MRTRQVRLALAVSVACSAAPLPGQVVTPVRGGTGSVTPATFAADAFTHAFGFRIQGIAPGAQGPSAPSLVGALAPCVLGEPCQRSASGVQAASTASYLVSAGLNFPDLFGSAAPALSVVNPDGSTPSLLLAAPADQPIDALYVSLVGPAAGGFARLYNLVLITDPITLTGVTLDLDLTLGGGESAFRLYQLPGDLRGGFALFAALDTEGLTTAPLERPSLDLIFGARAVETTIPEPGAAVLLGSGLAVLLLLHRVRRTGGARHHG